MKILSNISLKNFLKCGFSLFVFIPLSALPQSSDFVLFPASLIVSCDNIPPVAVIGTEVTSNNSCPPDNITYLGQITSDSSCPEPDAPANLFSSQRNNTSAAFSSRPQVTPQCGHSCCRSESLFFSSGKCPHA